MLHSYRISLCREVRNTVFDRQFPPFPFFLGAVANKGVQIRWVLIRALRLLTTQVRHVVTSRSTVTACCSARASNLSAAIGAEAPNGFHTVHAESNPTACERSDLGNGVVVHEVPIYSLLLSDFASPRFRFPFLPPYVLQNDLCCHLPQRRRPPLQRRNFGLVIIPLEEEHLSKPNDNDLIQVSCPVDREHPAKQRGIVELVSDHRVILHIPRIS